MLRVPSEYGTIQGAADSARENDIILIADGNYAENVEITRSLTIRSENGFNSTLITAAHADQHTLSVLANHTTIQGLTIKGATGMDRAGIYAQYAHNLTLLANRVSSNYNGIHMYRVANVTLEGNEASLNANCGILVEVKYPGSCRTEVTNNKARSNNGTGIVVTENVVDGSVAITGNRIEDNVVGLNYSCAKGRSEEVGFGHDIVSHNLITNNSQVGLAVSVVSVRTILEVAGNSVLRNGAGIQFSGVSTGGFNISHNAVGHNTGAGLNGSWINTGFNFTDRKIGAMLHGNTIEHNDGVGIAVIGAKTSGEVLFTGNELNNNTGSGILIAGLKGSRGFVVEDNVVECNGGLGVELPGLRVGGASSIKGNAIRGNGGRPGFLALSGWEDLVYVWEDLHGRSLKPEDFEGLGGLALISSLMSSVPVINNTVWSNNGTGIMFGGIITGNGTMYGNTVANNSGHGVLLLDTSGAGRFDRNRIMGNALSGVEMGSGTDKAVYDFAYNEIIGNRRGLVLNGSLGSVIAHNDVSMNREYGIYLRGGIGNEVSNCTIHGNRDDPLQLDEFKAGIYAWGVEAIRITANQVWGNYNGIVVDRGTDVLVAENIVDGNLGAGVDVDVMFSGIYNISANVARNNGAVGISLGQRSAYGTAHVYGNYLNGNRGGLVYLSAKGAYLDGRLHSDIVSWNTIVHDLGPGLTLSLKHGAGYVTEVDYNNISFNAAGLLITDKSGSGSVIRHNTVCGNNGSGMMGSWKNSGFNSTGYWVFDAELVEAIYGEAPYGVNRDWLAVLLQNNTVTGNNGPGLALLEIKCGGAIPIIDNTIIDNSGSGVLIPGASNGGPNPMLGNTIVGNKGAGIEIYSAKNGGQSPISGNTISDNEGIDVLVDLGTSAVNQDLVGRMGANLDEEFWDLAEILEDLQWSIADRKDDLAYAGIDDTGIEFGHQGGIFIWSDKSGGYPILDNVIQSNGGDGVSMLEVKSGAGMIVNNTLAGNLGTGLRILVSKAYSGTISSNTVERSGGHGVWIYFSKAGRRSIANNTIKSSGLSGIFLGPGAQQYEVVGNLLSGNAQGVLVNGTAGGSIRDNSIQQSELGIALMGSTECSVSGNLIWDNAGYGIRLESGSANLIWNNSFVWNNGASGVHDPARVQAYDSGNGNHWNGSSDAGNTGNYWSDWTSPDEDLDGFVDVAYLIDGEAGSKDLRPLASSAMILSIPPLPPAGLIAKAGAMLVNLSWLPPQNRGEQAPLSYGIYRGNESHRSLVVEVPSSSTRFIDLDVIPGLAYHYHVTASNSYGMSGPSGLALASPLYPATTPLVAISHPANGSLLSSEPVSVQWSGDGNGSPVVGFEVRMDMGGWVDVALETHRSFPDLSDGVHQVEVRIRNAGGGNATASSFFILDRTGPILTIIEPVNGTLTNLDSIRIGWEGLDQISGIDGYRLRLDAGAWEDLGGSASVVSDGLADGMHTFQVEASDLAGNKAIRSGWFRVDTVAPVVIGKSPVGDDVPACVNISLTFSEEMSDVWLTLSPRNASWQLVWDNLTAVFLLGTELSESVTYHVTIMGEDLAGNPLGRHEWFFTVAETRLISALALAILLLERRLGTVRRPD